MIKDTLKQIADAKSKLASLEEKAASELSSKLTNLHTDLGYESREDLIAALQGLGSAKKATGKKRGRKPGKKAAAKAPKAAKAAPAKKAGGKKARAKRTRITDELKSKVIAAVKAGGKGAAIATQFGISVPSLQNIKKAAGLIKARKK